MPVIFYNIAPIHKVYLKNGRWWVEYGNEIVKAFKCRRKLKPNKYFYDPDNIIYNIVENKLDCTKWLMADFICPCKNPTGTCIQTVICDEELEIMDILCQSFAVDGEPPLLIEKSDRAFAKIAGIGAKLEEKREKLPVHQFIPN